MTTFEFIVIALLLVLILLTLRTVTKHVYAIGVILRHLALGALEHHHHPAPPRRETRAGSARAGSDS